MLNMKNGNSSSGVIAANDDSTINDGHSNGTLNTQLSSMGHIHTTQSTSNVDAENVTTEGVLSNQLSNMNLSSHSTIDNTELSNSSSSQRHTAEASELLTAFTLFPELPTELQLKIWKHAIPGPRVMKIKTHVPGWLKHQPDASRDDYDWVVDRNSAIEGLEFSTDTKACGLLGACKISRTEILKVYRSIIESKGGKIRFDGDNDTILLHGEEHLSIKDQLLGCPGSTYSWPARTLRNYTSLFAGVKTLAWSENQFYSIPMDDRSWLVSQFRSLEKLILVSDGAGRINPENWADYNQVLNKSWVRELLTDENVDSYELEDLQVWLDYVPGEKVQMQHLRKEFLLWKEHIAPQWEVPEIGLGFAYFEPKDSF